jgi:hypothetical protein
MVLTPVLRTTSIKPGCWCRATVPSLAAGTENKDIRVTARFITKGEERNAKGAAISRKDDYGCGANWPGQNV